MFVTRSFTPDAFEGWAWRIPFLFGLLIPFPYQYDLAM